MDGSTLTVVSMVAMMVLMMGGMLVGGLSALARRRERGKDARSHGH
jgi:hypothetical protein